MQNPLDDELSGQVRGLQSLVDAAPEGSRAELDELMAVGEWPHVIRSLRGLDLPWTEQQRTVLDDHVAKAGLAPSA